MPNPNIPQGTLNRLKASVVVADFPELNVTASFLGKEMIHLAPEGEATNYIETAAGAVRSPNPYQKVTLTVHLLKTQAIAPAYQAKMETDSALGNVTIFPDVQTGQGLKPYQLINCSVQNVREMAFDGMDAGWVLIIGGYYLVNSSLWD